MSAAQSARIASDAGVGRLVLSHLNPNTPVDEYLNEAKALFENTEAAVLMKTIEV
jgi:ribonuclease BN (tRNA processing enzyme)